jgi:NAD(P)-dependent dehydrogenase (short-subunit alcohol dehydrogenase family)
MVHEDQLPGHESRLEPKPEWKPRYEGSDRLKGKVALVTGGDSGIGRAVAALFAREGADVAIVYLCEHDDANKTKEIVEKEGRKAIGDISEDQLRRTFQTNIFGMFFMTQAALAHLGEGSAIINTTSVTMYKGSKHLLDYSATKGAITAFTRSLALNLVEKGIRVNAVAPGPIWTPLNPFGGQPPEKIPEFGKDTPMGRPGQPSEVAPSFLFLACDDASYMTGQVLHPDGGESTSS